MSELRHDQDSVHEQDLHVHVEMLQCFEFSRKITEIVGLDSLCIIL